MSEQLFTAAEAAARLGMTEGSFNSARKRLDLAAVSRDKRQGRPGPGSPLYSAEDVQRVAGVKAGRNRTPVAPVESGPLC